MTALANRMEFVLLFDVVNGNPNGDPDMGNMPRIDPQTRHGLVTDVCLKRKLRNYVDATRHGQKGYEIYVQEKAVLNNQNKRAYDAEGLVPEKRRLPGDKKQAEAVTQWMCDTFFDIRAFGAVMSTDVNSGQVRGPIQIAFGQSIDPVQPLNLTITRMAVTTDKEATEQHGDNRTMGDKWIVPYGLYRTHGFISAYLAGRTGFSTDDLAILTEGLQNMFDLDRSASRGEMACRGLYLFRHESELGNAPAHKLFETVTVKKNIADAQPPRGFGDYTVEVHKDRVPAGVALEILGV